MSGKTVKINIAEDYTQYPGGRYPNDGEGNGESFRAKFLVPVLDAGDRAEIILDGTQGYPSSFLEEAFGGLVRLGYDVEKVLSSFIFKADKQSFKRFVPMIEEHIKRAGRQAKLG